MLNLRCLFATDLHGSLGRFMRLFQQIHDTKPDLVFIGGDVLPFTLSSNQQVYEFIKESFLQKIESIRSTLHKDIRFFVILGNDDPRQYEQLFQDAHDTGTIEYIHQKTVRVGSLYVSGYSFIPPTPFQLKDWERYDVSSYVDVGAVSPELGVRTVDVSSHSVRDATIAEDLRSLSENAPVEKTIFLFHAPPYDTHLDRTGLDHKSIDHVPLDVHVGSIAIKRFILEYQPFITLHGHVHESSTLTGFWSQQIGKTFAFNAAYDGPDLAVIEFDTTSPKDATRTIFPLCSK